MKVLEVYNLLVILLCIVCIHLSIYVKIEEPYQEMVRKTDETM